MFPEVQKHFKNCKSVKVTTTKPSIYIVVCFSLAISDFLEIQVSAFLKVAFLGESLTFTLYLRGVEYSTGLEIVIF